ncbi:hypothetical protein LO762_01915 [Actinocorallia sp. API 0066]|uniref:hypothetical protein n=1 Tax=Actinocorallia sp. API 0066 TaxID=2896846 RepID=UPI001E41CFEF|nr:hypothetical protein [Actinocorallia sp. API 0066]MCD0447956.1 hypothetical protein [Actinocorallia sp. API 0066]
MLTPHGQPRPRRRLPAAILVTVLVAIGLVAAPSPALAGCITITVNGQPQVVCAADGETPGNGGGGNGPGNGPGGGGGGNGGGPGNGPANCGGVGGGCFGDGDNVPPPPAIVPTGPLVDAALDAAQFLIPVIHYAPEDETYVRLKTAFWIDQEQFEVVVSQASVGGPGTGIAPQTVTATATPKLVLWNLVEDEVQCPGPGKVKGVGPGVECEYSYKQGSANQPGGTYTISATVVYEVAWVCAPAPNCTDLGDDLADVEVTGEAELTVDEIQSEASNGD